MPKKKLTKAQVNKKLQSVRRALYDLFIDKFAYGSESFIPMSGNKIEEFHRNTVSALLRMRK
jgi:hypothetical protein